MFHRCIASFILSFLLLRNPSNFAFRVEFPHILNINEYLCDEVKNSLNKAAGTVLEAPPSPINDDESSEQSTKGDDTSTTDSTSIVDDEGCHAAGTLHGSTSGSNSSGSNVDMQVDLINMWYIIPSALLVM